MREKTINKAKEFARKFTVPAPLNKEEREQNDEIIQAISAYWLVGHDSREDEISVLNNRIMDLRKALLKVMFETNYGPLLTDGTIVLVRNTLEKELSL